MSHKQGETVSLALVAATIGAAPVALPIFDANGVPRTLLATERLLIDALEGNVSAGSADVMNASTLASSTLIASFNTAVGLDLDSGEGFSLPVGATPFVLATTSTATVKIAGVGRVISGKTQGVRPSFKELLTPGGNF